jgi:hypothetical protein
MTQAIESDVKAEEILSPPVTLNPLGEFLAEQKLVSGDILVHTNGMELRVSVWAHDGRSIIGVLPMPFGLSDQQLLQALQFGQQLAAHLGISPQPASA